MGDWVQNRIPEISSFGKSDRGLRRANNEDAFAVKPELGIMALADGMGGAAAGELASRIFIESALEVFSESAVRSEQEATKLVRKIFQRANEKILNHVKDNPRHKGMGCTAELMVYYGENFILGHVGDSRTYRFRKGQLQQLTHDHSLVQDQIDKGLIALAEAKNHSLRNVILRAVGVRENLAIDLVRGKIPPGDLFLICSDGLTNMVDDNSIKDVLSSDTNLPQKVEYLIELAKASGGDDNITVILSQIMGL